MLRKVAGVIAGLFIAFLLVEVAEIAVHRLYPLPAGTSMQDFAAVRKFVATLPVAAFLLVLTGWLIGTFSATFVAARIGRSVKTGYVLAAILLTFGIVNSFVIPQPAWFSAASFVIYVVGGIAGARLGAPPRRDVTMPRG